MNDHCFKPSFFVPPFFILLIIGSIGQEIHAAALARSPRAYPSFIFNNPELNAALTHHTHAWPLEEVVHQSAFQNVFSLPISYLLQIQKTGTPSAFDLAQIHVLGQDQVGCLTSTCCPDALTTRPSYTFGPTCNRHSFKNAFIATLLFPYYAFVAHQIGSRATPESSDALPTHLKRLHLLMNSLTHQTRFTDELMKLLDEHLRRYRAPDQQDNPGVNMMETGLLLKDLPSLMKPINTLMQESGYVIDQEAPVISQINTIGIKKVQTYLASSFARNPDLPLSQGIKLAHETAENIPHHSLIDAYSSLSHEQARILESLVMSSSLLSADALKTITQPGFISLFRELSGKTNEELAHDIETAQDIQAKTWITRIATLSSDARLSLHTFLTLSPENRSRLLTILHAFDDPSLQDTIQVSSALTILERRIRTFAYIKDRAVLHKQSITLPNQQELIAEIARFRASDTYMHSFIFSYNASQQDGYGLPNHAIVVTIIKKPSHWGAVLFNSSGDGNFYTLNKQAIHDLCTLFFDSRTYPLPQGYTLEKAEQNQLHIYEQALITFMQQYETEDTAMPLVDVLYWLNALKAVYNHHSADIRDEAAHQKMGLTIELLGLLIRNGIFR